jgi:uncharacterized protein YukE
MGEGFSLSAAPFSSIDTDLQALEDLIKDTIANTEEQQRLLQDLKESLNESENLIADYENIITEQEILLANLREQLNAMSKTYQMQSNLSARYEQRLRFWKLTTLIGIPVTALISGVVVWVAN